MDAFAAYSEYMSGMIAERKKEPTDDLVSVLVHAEVEGEQLADDEIVTEVLLILIGGDETTRHTLSGGTEQLLRHPDQHQLWSTTWNCCRARSRRCCAGPRR